MNKTDTIKYLHKAILSWGWFYQENIQSERNLKDSTVKSSIDETIAEKIMIFCVGCNEGMRYRLSK